MNNKFLFFLYLFSVKAFIPSFKKINNISKIKMHNENKNFNQDNNKDYSKKKKKEIKILNINYEEMIKDFDLSVLNNLNHNIPIHPQNENEIEEDSFEGYLKSEFYKIANKDIKNNKNLVIINFETFYYWRKTIGTVLYKKEIEEIFLSITDNKYECDLMNFILINKIIDENDGAKF